MRATTLRQPRVWLPTVSGIGAAVALGVYGRLHEPAPAAFLTIAAKAWLATAVVTLAVVQLLSALSLWGRLPPVRWAAPVHRWSGRSAVLLSLPVAGHCLYALGFNFTEPRALAHSALGCLFYGAFVAKMLLISRPGEGRAWVLPVAGGLVLTAVAGLWLTSSLWFFVAVGAT